MGHGEYLGLTLRYLPKVPTLGGNGRQNYLKVVSERAEKMERSSRGADVTTLPLGQTVFPAGLGGGRKIETRPAVLKSKSLGE